MGNQTTLKVLVSPDLDAGKANAIAAQIQKLVADSTKGGTFNLDAGQAEQLMSELAAQARQLTDTLQQPASVHIDPGDSAARVHGVSEAVQDLDHHAHEASEGGVEKLKEKLHEGLGTAGAILGIQGLASTVEGSFEKFAEAAQSSAALDLAFASQGEAGKKAAEDLKEYAKARQEATGITHDQTEKILMFGRTLGGITDPEKLKAFATAVQNEAAATGKDVETVSQMLAAKLEAGGKDKILGVQFKPGETEKNIDLFIQSANSKLQGFADKMGSTPAGAVKKFQATFSDLQEIIGKLLVTVLGPFIPFLSKIVEELGKVLEPLGDVLTAALGPVSDVLGQLIGPISELLSALLPPLSTILKVVISSALTLVQPLLAVASEILPQLVAAVTPVLAVFGDLIQIIAPIIAAISPLAIIIRVFAQELTLLLPPVLKVIQVIASFVDQLLRALQPAIDAILPVLTMLAQLIAGVLAQALTIGERLFRAIVGAVVTLVGRMIGVTDSTKAFGSILQWVQGAVQTVVSWLTELRGIIGGVQAAFGVVTDTIGEFLDALSHANVVDAIKAFAGFGDKVVAAFNKGRAAATAYKDDVKAATEEAAAPPPPPPPPPPAKKGADPFELAKQAFDLQKTTLETAQKQNDVDTESARIKEKRKKDDVDDLATEQGKLKLVQDELDALLKVLRVRNGKVGIQVNDKEVVEATKMLNDLKTQVGEQTNRVSELRLKLIPQLDPDSIRKAQEDRLKVDIDLGVKNKSELETFLAGDIDALQSQLDKITERRKGELERLHTAGVLSEQEFQAAMVQVTAQGEKEQLDVLTQIAAKRKELRDMIAQRELAAAAESAKAQEEILKRQMDAQKTLLDAMLKLAETVGKQVIDAQKVRRQGELDQQQKAGLISEQKYNDEKGRIDERAASDQEALQARLRGAKLEADRQAALLTLAQQRGTLAEQKRILTEQGKTDEAAAVGKQLDAVNAQIEEKGSIMSGLAEDLQGNVGELFSNLFAGSEAAAKQPFKKTFAVLAGGLQRLASAKVVEVLLGSISGLAGFPGLLATFLLKPLVEAGINQIFGSIVGQLLSFSTGARVDAPTLAMIGDGSRLGGSDTEWVLRDDQLRQIMGAVLAAFTSSMVGELQAIRSAVEEWPARLVARGGDLVAATNGTRSRSKRRIIGKRSKWAGFPVSAPAT